MRIKKILSLAVVLAMVMAVVPAFGITASAAETDNTWVIFDATQIKTSFKGDIALQDYYDAAPFHKVYSAPGGSYKFAALYSTQWNNDGTWSSNADDANGLPTVMFFRDRGRGGDTSNDENQSMMFADASETKGANKITIEYQYAAQVANNNYQRWEFRDADGTAFAQIYTDIGQNQTDGKDNSHITFGKTETLDYIASAAGSREEVKKQIGNTFKIEASKNAEDDKFTVKYFVKSKEGSGEFEEQHSESIDKINGVGSVYSFIERWNDPAAAMGMMGLKITLEFPETTKVVTATYKLGEDVINKITKTYDSNDAENATFPEYFGSDGNSVIYKADETSLNASKDVNVSIVENDAAPSEVITARNGVKYQLTGKNIIPNGEFKYGLAGWFDGRRITPDENGTIKVSSDSDGTITLGSSNHYSDGSLYRSFPLEPNTLYVFTVYNGASGDYNRVSLGSVLGNDTNNPGTETFPVYGRGSAGNAYENAPVGQSYYAFNSKDYKYLTILYRWANNEKVGKFGLYKATAMDGEPTFNGISTEQTILAGSKPFMPEVISVSNGEVEGTMWIDTAAINQVGKAETIDITDKLTGESHSITADITINPYTYNLPDQGSNTAGNMSNNKLTEYNGILSLGHNLTGKFYAEFDLEIIAIDDYTVQFAPDKERWGSAAFGIGIKNGIINITGGNGNGDTDNGTTILEGAEAGKTYRVFVDGDVSSHTVNSISVIAPDGKSGKITQRADGQNINFRKNVAYINAFNVCGNNINKRNELFIRNVKVYDDNYTNEIPAFTPELAWTGSDFAINFMLGEAGDGQYTVNVAKKSADSGEFDQSVDTETTIDVSDENKGFTLTTANTNDIYKATAEGTVNGVKNKTVDMAEGTSVYSLVMENLKKFIVEHSEDDSTIKADQVAKVNEVIKKGGLFLTKGGDGKYQLPAEVQGILSVETANTTVTVTIDDKAFSAGLKFIDSIASNAGENVSISENGKTVTISDVSLENAEILSLETVELEFVPSEIVETVGETVSEEIDFIEEL